MDDPKYSVAHYNKGTPKKLVQGSLQTSLTASPAVNLASSSDGSTSLQSQENSSEMTKVRQGVKVLTVSRGLQKGSKRIQIVDHAERKKESVVVDDPTKSVRTFINPNPKPVNVNIFLKPRSKSTVRSKILCDGNTVVKCRSEDLISEESSSLALNHLADSRHGKAAPATSTTRFPKARYMDYNKEPKSKSQTGLKPSTSRDKLKTTRKPPSAKNSLRSDSMKKSFASTTRAKQLQRNATGGSAATGTPVSSAKSKASQKTSTPNSKNKTFFEPDLSVVQPPPTKSAPAAKDDAVKGKPKKAANAKKNCNFYCLNQSSLDVTYAQYLRQRLIEKKIREDYDKRHEKALEALSHMVLENKDLEQEVADIEKRMLTLEYNGKFSEDLNSQHALLTPIVKELDRTVGYMQELGHNIDAVRHTLPVQDIIIPNRDHLQHALARVEVNLEKIEPFIELMDGNGRGLCNELAEVSQKSSKVCHESKELATLHNKMEFEDMYLSNLEDQSKLARENVSCCTTNNPCL